MKSKRKPEDALLLCTDSLDGIKWKSEMSHGYETVVKKKKSLIGGSVNSDTHNNSN